MNLDIGRKLFTQVYRNLQNYVEKIYFTKTENRNRFFLCFIEFMESLTGNSRRPLNSCKNTRFSLFFVLLNIRSRNISCLINPKRK